MVPLQELLQPPVKVTMMEGDISRVIRQIAFDSRRVAPECLFIAVPGTQVDGHDYIDQALEAGATSILCEKLPKTRRKEITYVQVENSAQALAHIAKGFFGNPSKKIKLIGITGTNGKTTIATLLHDLFTQLGYKTGLLSTIVNKIGVEKQAASHTTPDALALNELLAKMVNENCGLCFMEVSSHAIDQYRVEGLEFDGGVFTNLSHDHLDYHNTFLEYLYTKKKFFDHLSEKAFALVNVDDKRAKVMVQNTKAKIYEYSLLTLTDYKAKIIENVLSGLHLDINGNELFSRLVGKFNAYNLLAIFAVGDLLDVSQNELLRVISQLGSAPGRFDLIMATDQSITGIVDYAHTPDALKNVLETITDTKTQQAKIITVVGCGGNRDQGKRPLMANIAAGFSDRIILTNDNPRNEDPEFILDQMETGLSDIDKKKCIRIADRAQAIKTACLIANAGDIILVAGKGHENYQEIKGTRIPFDDKAELMNSLGLN